MKKPRSNAPATTKNLVNKAIPHWAKRRMVMAYVILKIMKKYNVVMDPLYAFDSAAPMYQDRQLQEIIWFLAEDQRCILSLIVNKKNGYGEFAFNGQPAAKLIRSDNGEPDFARNLLTEASQASKKGQIKIGGKFIGLIRKLLAANERNWVYWR